MSRRTGAMMSWMMSCREATRLLSEAQDHPLPWRQRLGLRLHLLMCRLCARYAAQLRFLRRALRRLPREVDRALPEARLGPEARRRILEGLRRVRPAPPPGEEGHRPPRSG